MESSEKVLDQLVEATSAIAQGRYDEAQAVLELTKQGIYPEAITRLAESFGMMLVKVEGRQFVLEQTIEELRRSNLELEASLAKIQWLERIREVLGKFVPHSVRSKVAEDPQALSLERHEENMAILFLDIGGFTSLSEQATPEAIHFLVERYFSSFIEAILKHGGEICESQGDGLMLIFGESAHHEEHPAVRAVRAALAIRDKVLQINQGLVFGETPIVVNIGIDFGLVMVGSTKFESFAGDRWTYTAYGQAVNRASRIGKLAMKGEILVSAAVHEVLANNFLAVDKGTFSLKNISQVVAVYEMLGIRTGPRACPDN